MNQDIIDSFKSVFGELKQQYHLIENQLKNDASKEIADLFANNRFDESKKAVDILENLLVQIRFDINFDEIDRAIQRYVTEMHVLKNGNIVPNMSQVLSHKPTQIAQAEANAVVQLDNLTENQDDTDNIQHLRATLENHQFQIIKIENNDFHFQKKNKKYYMTALDNPISNDEIKSILEQNTEVSKNIGFICNTDEEMQMAKVFSEDWAKNNQSAKTKYLTINFTSKEKLEKKNINPLISVSF